MAGDVPAVTAAVRVLERLAAAAPATVSPGRLAQELGLNRSTCYNVLATLRRAGWASTQGDRAGWTIGPRLLALAEDALEIVAGTTQQELEVLAADVGLIAFVAERDGSDGYVVTAKAERQSGVRVTVGIGDRFPFSAPALMQAFCAWLPSASFDRLATEPRHRAIHGPTVVDRDELQRVFAQVRRDGFSRSIRQFNLAQAGVASPVFDSKGRVLRAVCCLGFSSELDEETVEQAGAAVKACAERITARTGGTLPVPPAEEPLRA